MTEPDKKRQQTPTQQEKKRRGYFDLLAYQEFTCVEKDYGVKSQQTACKFSLKTDNKKNTIKMTMDGLVYVNFSEAAREGDLSALKRCSRKDTNRRDIDGMTPVQWAASYGNLEALRILVGKGGNPDKPNNEGHTSLHLAASAGQLHCLVFLTNFGGNIYTMSDSGTTPIQEAANKGRVECIRHLETFITHQVEQDRNKVEKMQEKAKRDAERRIKEKGKLLKKLDRDYEKKSAKHRKLGGNTYLHASKQNGSVELDETDNNNNDHLKLTYSQLTGLPYEEDRPDDDSSTTSSFRRIEEEFLTRTSLTSDDILLERGMFPSNDKNSEITENSNITSSTNSKRSLQGGQSLAASLRSIPTNHGVIQNGYGLRGYPGPTITLKNGKIINVKEIGDFNYSNGQSFGKPVQLQNGSIILPNKQNGKPNNVADIQMGPLFTFLAALQLEENREIFLNEKIDLRACLLCDEDDLREIGLPLGPRKKIVDAIKQRNIILENGTTDLKDSAV